MKKALMAMMVAVTAAGAVFAQSTSLAEARAKIGDLVSSPTELTALMKQLSAADQKQFVADVNEAIGKMPGSSESKAATSLNANRALLKGAQKGNLSVLLAEVYATASLEALTIINERFAADLFNRSSDPSVTYTDEQYAKIAEESMKLISERCASADSPAVRDTLALMMFVRASNGTPKDLTDKLLPYIPESSRDVAKNEWIPAGLSDGENRSYEQMLGSADVDQLPNLQQTLVIAGPQLLDAMLFDLSNGLVDANGYPTTTFTEAASSTSSGIWARDIGLGRVPRRPEVTTGNSKTKNRLGLPRESTPEPEEPEPGPYQGQTTY